MIRDFHILIMPLAAFVVSFILLFVARRIILMFIRRWAKATNTNLDAIFTVAIETPSIYWILALSIYISIEMSDMPGKYAFYLARTLHVLVILSITITVANLSSKIFGHFVEHADWKVWPTGSGNCLITLTWLRV